ncbi:MAG: hypothetical protein RLY93_01285 [Sumerlaeia bacterium]
MPKPLAKLWDTAGERLRMMRYLFGRRVWLVVLGAWAVSYWPAYKMTDYSFSFMTQDFSTWSFHWFLQYFVGYLSLIINELTLPAIIVAYVASRRVRKLSIGLTAHADQIIHAATLAFSVLAALACGTLFWLRPNDVPSRCLLSVQLLLEQGMIPTVLGCYVYFFAAQFVALRCFMFIPKWVDATGGFITIIFIFYVIDVASYELISQPIRDAVSGKCYREYFYHTLRCLDFLYILGLAVFLVKKPDSIFAMLSRLDSTCKKEPLP